MKNIQLIKIFAILTILTIPLEVKAKLVFENGITNDGMKFLIIRGTFDFADDLRIFEKILHSETPAIITFDSPGGNIVRAMELGRLIRRFNIATLQFRKFECASACALAFMGGSSRFADPGSIGVHKSSFTATGIIGKQEAVSAIQDITADIISYMSEMGVNPALLKLALKTDADDIRYLSAKEMRNFNVTFSNLKNNEKIETNIDSAQSNKKNDIKIPIARSGFVRHPKGSVFLKELPTEKSNNITKIHNGTSLSIIKDQDRWYYVKTQGFSGYMHHTWVRVNEFDGTKYLKRLIQIKSFDKIEDALKYIKTIQIPASIYLSTNFWYAVTIDRSFELEEAKKLNRQLKNKKYIPKDSYVTFGNTYMLKVCCQE